MVQHCVHCNMVRCTRSNVREVMQLSCVMMHSVKVLRVFQVLYGSLHRCCISKGTRALHGALATQYSTSQHHTLARRAARLRRRQHPARRRSSTVHRVSGCSGPSTRCRAASTSRSMFSAVVFLPSGSAFARLLVVVSVSGHSGPRTRS